MLFGLQRVSGLTGSLLLNLEAPLTVVVAALVFREHVGRYAIASVVLIVGGAAVLRVEPGQFAADPIGIGLLGAACLAWALDNNLTQRLSLRDPFAIVRVKTLAAGTINLLLGLVVAREGLPAISWGIAAMVLGVCSYGVSVVLDAYALRLVGAAREAAYFASAPFMGALASIAIFRNSPSGYAIAAMAVMATGVALLLREKHGHEHEHELMAHEHMHTHDEHHQHSHTHDIAPAPGQPHSHAHHHTPLRHAHHHAPDVHHRHKH
ncbi:MAG: EamA family transporter, partial [Kofleriaceae bacterium]|nr:EamA family transporter [Kofleriaceae bacterium]